MTESYWTQLMSQKDPRTKDWVILDKSFITITLVGYLYMAKIWGPRFMKDRKPYNLSSLIQAYNAFQVAANVYYCSKIFYIAFIKSKYSFFCQGVTHSTDANSIELVDTLFYYFIIRIIDFADTLFFILRKKFSHISQLHVYHHTIVIFTAWQFLQFGADGQSAVGVCLNSMMHIIMYSYYFLSSLGPAVQKYLWWKKYLTTLQITQFLVMIGHGLIPLVVDCGYPRILMTLALPQIFVVLVLFINFYVQAYSKSKNTQTPKKMPATGVRHLPQDGAMTTPSSQEDKTILEEQIKSE